MKATASMPNTAKSRISYLKGGTRYSGVIPTQSSVSEIQRFMLFQRKTALKAEDILSVEPVQPPADFVRPSPAAKAVDRFTAAMVS